MPRHSAGDACRCKSFEATVLPTTARIEDSRPLGWPLERPAPSTVGQRSGKSALRPVGPCLLLPNVRCEGDFTACRYPSRSRFAGRGCRVSIGLRAIRP